MILVSENVPPIWHQNVRNTWNSLSQDWETGLRKSLRCIRRCGKPFLLFDIWRNSPLAYWITIRPIATEWSLCPYIQPLSRNSACHDPLHIDCEVGYSHCVTVFILCGPRIGHIRSRSQVICGRQRFRENWGRAAGPNKISAMPVYVHCG